MSDEIINAIRILVEDGAEVTYSRDKDQPSDYYQGILAGRLYERERIIQELKELAYKSEDGYEMISEYKSELIARIKEEKK